MPARSWRLHPVACRSPTCWKHPSPQSAAAVHALDTLLESAEIELVPVTLEHLKAARRAWRRFGKGNHPAALNFGGCFAYALAKTTGEPLLFKGEDFTRTDIEAA